MHARWRLLITIALFLVLTLAAIGPIRNYDLFWHLATGRWITEHRALPAMDPFAVASDRVPWINGEWLFEIVLSAFERAGGITGLSWIRALFIAGLFTTAFRLTRREAEDENALLAAALAFAGAMATIDLRPSGIAALFVVLAIDTVCANRRRALVVFAILTILWINVHPSALLAPLIALLIRPRSWLPVVGAGALLVNPHGVYGVLSPLKLMTFVQSGAFVNAEWLPSSPRLFPLLYISMIVAVIVFLTTNDRRAHVWRIPLLILFSYLAIRHVRNQPLWFAAFPLLVAPPVRKIPRVAAYAASIALIAWIAVRSDHRLGVSPSRFPIDAVSRLQSTHLRGNIYNPDQFGGFLIWSFYPERRALTDGRNELYHAFIPEYARARNDQRAWRALLHKYRIDLAVDEHRPPLDVLDAATGKMSKMPASLAYWPRNEWALIAQDRAAMVFARRAAFPNDEMKKWEIAR